MELTVYISPHFSDAVFDRFGIIAEKDKMRALVNLLNNRCYKGWFGEGRTARDAEIYLKNTLKQGTLGMSDNTIFVALREFPVEVIKRLQIEPNCYLAKTAYPDHYPYPNLTEVEIDWKYKNNAVETFYEYYINTQDATNPVTACPSRPESSASSFSPPRQALRT